MFLLFQKPMLGRILDERDIVLLDQRGAGHSQPLLDCPELHSLPWVAVRAAYDIAKLVNDALALFGDGTRTYTYVDAADPKITLKLSR